MTRLNDKYRISLWLIPDEMLNCAYGRITFREWCDKECERLSRQGDPVEVCKNEQGRIALFRRDVSRRTKESHR